MPMKLFSRLFGSATDPRDALRPLWHRVVEIAREKRWYAEMGVADTVEGRFDMITAILALVLLRLEDEEELMQASVFLTELFVEDMDGQLRESGVGDVVVGKHIGRLIAALGGRLGAYREGLAAADESVLREAAARNVGLVGDTQPDALAKALRSFAQQLRETASERIVAGGI
jgi:cytochrome b pre-mRNA-processing protein 3